MMGWPCTSTLSMKIPRCGWNGGFHFHGYLPFKDCLIGTEPKEFQHAWAVLLYGTCPALPKSTAGRFCSMRSCATWICKVFWSLSSTPVTMARCAKHPGATSFGHFQTAGTLWQVELTKRSNPTWLLSWHNFPNNKGITKISQKKCKHSTQGQGCAAIRRSVEYGRNMTSMTQRSTEITEKS